MRISADRNDPGYNAREVPFAAVEFNGVRQHPTTTFRGIITADEEAGRIDFRPFDPATGRPIQEGGQPALRTEYGAVRVILGGARDDAANPAHD